MPGLQDLAPKLLISIIQYLTPESQSNIETDLYQLARVSRKLYNITEPYLCMKYIQEGSAYPGVKSKSTSLLLRTILEKPEYASRIKMACSNGLDEDDGAEGFEQLKDLHLRMVDVCEQFNLPADTKLTRDQWISALTERTPKACFAVVVLLLPNLKSLDMTASVDFDEQMTFMSQAMKLTSQSPEIVLPKLEVLLCGIEEGCFLVEEIMPFFYLPSLREVVLYGLCAEELTLTTSLASQIESLDISRCGVEDGVWLILLQPMQHLKHLTYSPGNPKYVGFMDNSPGGLSAGLQVVKNTLEYLNAGEYNLEDEVSLLGSLRDFPNLREIDVQMGILIGLEDNKSTEDLWKLLPFGLEKVSFIGGEHEWSDYNGKSRLDTMEQVMGMVLGSETHFPNLRHISMSYCGDLDLEPLKAICTARSIVLNDW